MKRLFCCLLAAVMALAMLSGCGSTENSGDSGDTLLLATTQPMYELTQKIIAGATGITVQALIQDQVSCLHDYTITTDQMKKIERADLVILSGAGLEDFMSSSLSGKDAADVIDSSEGIELLGDDPHIWLDPRRYVQQGENIVEALSERYPDQAELFQQNMQAYADALLGEYQNNWYPAAQSLSCKELITFHDGFSYFADAYDLTILAAIEEEEGAEPSAAELKEIVELTESHHIPMIFTEKNGAANAAEIVAQETGVKTGVLDLGMSGGEGSYAAVMDANLDALKAGLK